MNQKGVALVIVLLMITVFSILALSVFSFIISNTKQIDKSEKDMQSVDLAEMGVVYYKSAFIKNADSILNDSLKAAVTAIQSYNSINDPDKDINKENILQELDNILSNPNTLNKFVNVTNIVFSKSIIPDANEPKYFFTIDKQNPPTYNKTNHIISVSFKSIGTAEDKSKTISTTIHLDLGSTDHDIIQSYLDNGGGTGNTSSNIIMDGVTKPVTNSTCQQNGPIQNGCSSTNDINNGSNDITNLSAMINGSLYLSDSKKQIRSVANLFITKNAYLGDINGQIMDSTIFIGGNATFGVLDGGIHNSKLFILGNAIFNTINGKDVKNSIVCVGGTVSGLTVDNSSVFSWNTDKNIYNSIGVSKGCPQIEETSNSTSPILPQIVDQTNNNIMITYN